MKSFASITVNRLWKQPHSVSRTLKMTYLRILYISRQVMKEMKVSPSTFREIYVVWIFYHQEDATFNLNLDLCLANPKHWSSVNYDTM